MYASVLYPFVFIALAPLYCAQQYVPIPKISPGITYGNGSLSAPVQMDYFVDLECPDCQSNFPAIQKVAVHYGPSQFRLAIHIFPLPYHGNAYLAALAVQIVRQLKGEAPAISLVQLLFDNQDKWAADATAELTHVDIVKLLGNYTEKVGLSSQDFVHIVQERTYEGPTRIEWKYGCTRGVAGTPTHFLNGIKVDDGVMRTTKDWIDLIDSLLR